VQTEANGMALFVANVLQRRAQDAAGAVDCVTEDPLAAR
jgi:hypothetical protein